MHRLNREEFEDRINAVARARKIFIKSGLVANITDAFALYQGVLAEQDRAVIITTLLGGNRPPARFDKFERPKCPECGSDLMFRPLPPNEEGVNTQLVCENPRCDVALNSKMTIEEWSRELERKKDGDRPEQTDP
ncbi:MAG: hypothetical protein AB1585_19170 [Thermodesulfobacteriota bacterium]